MTPHSKPRHVSAYAISAFVAVLAGFLVALSLTGTAAAAATPCGKKVLADWFDNGRIDRLYPPHCYEEAIDAIPADLRDYADAEDVISRALTAALRGELDPGGADPTPGGGSGGAGGSGGSGGSSGSSGSGEGGGAEATEAPDVDASGPSSIPMPLVILGGMSLALLAAGGLGYVSRRRQAAGELADGVDGVDEADDPTLV